MGKAEEKRKQFVVSRKKEKSFKALFSSVLIFCFALIYFFLFIPVRLRADQGYLNFSFWSRNQLYSQTGPYYLNQYEHIFHLDLFQNTINYGNFAGWFDGNLSGSGFEAAHWYFSWQGFKTGQMNFNLKLGDDSFQFTNLGYRFTNYFPAYNYLRGIKAGFAYKGFGLDFFSGRVARLSGLLGTIYSLTDQTATGFLGHFEPDQRYYFGFGLLHTENEKSWTGELLTRTNDLLLLESELRINDNFKLVSETQASFSAGPADTAKIPGTSIRIGPLVNYNRWAFEINYRRIDAAFKSLSSEFIYDRDQEGLFASWRYQPRKSLYLFGSVDYFHDNVDRLADLNTTDFWRVYSGFSLLTPPWPDLTFRLDLAAAESRKIDENYRHYFSPGFFLQLSKYLGNFYPYLRIRYQHFDDQVNDQRDFTYPSIFLGLRYSYLRNAYLLVEAENTRYYDYLQNRISTQSRYRIANYSPVFWGTDFYGELSYSNYSYEYNTSYGTKRLELYLGLTKQLPWRVKLRLDLRTSWPLASTLPANYWITIKVDRRFNWGEAPTFQGRAYGQVLTGMGRLEGLIFSDLNLNGLFDPGEKVFPDINVQLEDGSMVTSDRQGKFIFSRVPEGLHTVSLEVRNIPADFYLLGPERQPIVVEKRKTSRINFVLIEGVTIGGQVFQDSNKNGLFDEEDQPLKDVLIWLKPVAREGAGEILEKMKREELNTYTDEKGNFIFDNILPGPYELRVDEETLPRGVKLITELPLRIELKPGEKIKDLKIIYHPRPVIFTGKGRQD